MIVCPKYLDGPVLCTDDNPTMLSKLSVLHIDTSGDVVEQVFAVTPSHVKLSKPVFSARGVLMRAGFPVKINSNVLIYKTNKAFLTLHVYMILSGLQQIVALSYCHYIDSCFKTQTTMLAAVTFKLLTEYVVFPSGNKKEGIKQWKQHDPKAKSLKMRDRFILKADVDNAEICPEVRFELCSSH